MHEYYQTADLAVVPSEFEEPFGMVAIEAMAAGAPVLATRKGGLPEIVHEGVTGFRLTMPEITRHSLTAWANCWTTTYGLKPCAGPRANMSSSATVGNR